MALKAFRQFSVLARANYKLFAVALSLVHRVVSLKSYNTLYLACRDVHDKSFGDTLFTNYFMSIKASVTHL